MRMPADIRVVVLDGTPWERGRIHGEALRPMIVEGINRWKNDLQKLVGMDADEYVEQFIEETDFLSAIKKWTPDLLEEVRGIGEGAGIDLNAILAWQLLDEQWWYSLEKGVTRTAAGGEECSALGVFHEGGSPPLLAQNMDLPDHCDGLQVLLHIKHPGSDLQLFVFTIAGLIALNGMNNQAIGICCNTLMQLAHAPDGLPVAFTIRGVLGQSTLANAVKFVHEIKHASGQNYLIGGPEGIVDLECSAHRVCQFVPRTGATRVYHTNHPIVNDDTGIYEDLLERIPTPMQKLVDEAPPATQARFAFLESKLRDPSKRITVETIKSILSSHEVPVCLDNKDQGGGYLTFGCLIMVLSNRPELHLAPGRPCSTEFKTFDFD